MAKNENYVGWGATFYIWWAFIWRVMAGMFVADSVVDALSGRRLESIPLVSDLKIRIAVENHPAGFFVFLLLLHFWIYLWALRASLKDQYAGFQFLAENKVTGKSMFNLDKRLNMATITCVGWTLAWRILLVPLAITIGTVAAALLSHQDVARALNALDTTQALYFFGGLTLLISIGAMREILADRYGAFRFSAKQKSFYG